MATSSSSSACLATGKRDWLNWLESPILGILIVRQPSSGMVFFFPCGGTGSSPAQLLGCWTRWWRDKIVKVTVRGRGRAKSSTWAAAGAGREREERDSEKANEKSHKESQSIVSTARWETLFSTVKKDCTNILPAPFEAIQFQWICITVQLCRPNFKSLAPRMKPTFQVHSSKSTTLLLSNRIEGKSLTEFLFRISKQRHDLYVVKHNTGNTQWKCWLHEENQQTVNTYTRVQRCNTNLNLFRVVPRKLKWVQNFLPTFCFVFVFVI